MPSSDSDRLGEQMNSKNMTSRILILAIATLTGTRLGILVQAQQTPPRVHIEVSGEDLRVGTPFVIHLKNDLSVPITDVTGAFCTR